MNGPQGFQGTIGAGLLVSVLWAGSAAVKIPDELEIIKTNQKLILYRVDQLEKKGG